MPNRGPLATPETMREIATAAERLGYGYITVSDHIVVPRKIDPNYPYSENGEFRWTSDGEVDCMEQFTLLAWLAAVTSQIRIMTSVIVIPHRNPLFMAKSIATTDVLSGGRVTLGCGAGWMHEEFEALNLPDFAARGQVTNEYLDVMKIAWTDPDPSYDGEFYSFDRVDLEPRPVQDPHPPIWIGGESMPAIRRVVSHGDAWYPFGSNPKFRMDTVASYAARRDRLWKCAEEAGRDPATIALSYNCAFHNAEAQVHVDGGRQLVTGTPEQRAEDIAALGEAGISTTVVNVASNDKSEMLARMTEFSENVMPLVG